MRGFSGGHGEKKARKLDQFIAAMMSHKSIEDAAAAVGISPATAYRWMGHADVAQRLAVARRDAMSAAMSKLQDNALRAASNLDELQRTAESEAVRLAASRANLEFAFRTTETVDVLERLSAIEQKVNSPDWRNRNDREPNHAQARATRSANGHE